MGSDSGEIGMNGCLQTYHPQMHRYTYLGQIINNDFCFTVIKNTPGSEVSIALNALNVVKRIRR